MEWLKQHIVGVASLLFLVASGFVVTIQEQTELQEQVEQIKVEQDKRQKNVDLQGEIEKRLTILERNSESVVKILDNQAEALKNFKNQNSELRTQTALIKNTVTSLNKTLDKVNITLDKLNETVDTTNKDLSEVKISIAEIKAHQEHQE
jgi:chromosome segregation ATPase